MKIEKQKCLRCGGKGCADCSWSGVIFKNVEFEKAEKIIKNKFGEIK